jgi:hypothetical protein
LAFCFIVFFWNVFAGQSLGIVRSPCSNAIANALSIFSVNAEHVESSTNILTSFGRALLVIKLNSVSYNGVFGFSVEPHKNKPACATQNEWVIDPKKPEGKSIQAVVMLAHAEGKPVVVWGPGACDDWGYSEKPNVRSYC